MVKPAVKVKKRNCNTPPAKSKQTDFKEVLFRDFGCQFRGAVLNESELEILTIALRHVTK